MFHYAQKKLVGKAYCWGKERHIDYRCWFVLKDLCTLYAPHLLYLSEADYKEPEVVDEPEPLIVDKPEPQDVDEPDPEPPVIVEPDIIDEPDSEVVDETELEPEVKKPLIETLVEISVEPTMSHL